LDCKYHVVFVPKTTAESALQPNAPATGSDLHALARQKECQIIAGEHFWARGYAVSTVGFELEEVRKYIREQEAADGTNGQF
jgi:REP element-mobilizing transposase RayT